MDVAKRGQEACVKIEPIPGESPKMCGATVLVHQIDQQPIELTQLIIVKLREISEIT